MLPGCRTAGYQVAVAPGGCWAGGCAGGVLRRGLLGMDSCGSHQNRRQRQQQDDPDSGNRRELSNHSFSSRCRAWWQTVALGPYFGLLPLPHTSKTSASGNDGSAMLPPGLHSQQAGTILPTLMPIPPAMPPAHGGLQFPRNTGRTYDREFYFHSGRFLGQAELQNRRRMRPHTRARNEAPPAGSP